MAGGEKEQRMVSLGSISVSHLQSITQHLTCIFCSKLPKECRIFRCSIQATHVICETCYIKKNKHCCSLANFSYPEPRECKLSVTLRSFLPLDCKYKDLGCDQIHPIEDSVKHEKVCEFRFIYCAICFQPVQHKHFPRHLAVKKRHKYDRTDGNAAAKMMRYRFDVSQNERIWGTPRLFQLGARQFFFRFFPYKKFVFFWVYFYGSIDEAEKYYFSMKIHGTGNEAFSYTGKVTSMDEFWTDLLDHDRAFSLKTSLVQNCIADGKLDISMQLRSFNEEDNANHESCNRNQEEEPDEA